MGEAKPPRNGPCIAVKLCQWHNLFMTKTNVDSLVLATVNAPYSKKLDAAALVEYLRVPASMRKAVGPMSSFFYDVDIDLQRKFALSHGISPNALGAAAALFGTWSGMHWAGDMAA
jgi:hypothetical protein